MWTGAGPVAFATLLPLCSWPASLLLPVARLSPSLTTQHASCLCLFLSFSPLLPPPYTSPSRHPSFAAAVACPTGDPVCLFLFLLLGLFPWSCLESDRQTPTSRYEYEFIPPPRVPVALRLRITRVYPPPSRSQQRHSGPLPKKTQKNTRLARRHGTLSPSRLRLARSLAWRDSRHPPSLRFELCRLRGRAVARQDDSHHSVQSHHRVVHIRLAIRRSTHTHTSFSMLEDKCVLLGSLPTMRIRHRAPTTEDADALPSLDTSAWLWPCSQRLPSVRKHPSNNTSPDGRLTFAQEPASS